MHITVYDTITTEVFDTITIREIVYDTVRITVTDTLKIPGGGTGVPGEWTYTVLVFPNPAFDVLNIDFSDKFNTELSGWKARISTVLGQTVYEQQVTQRNFTIDIRSWQRTTYTLTLFNQEQQVKATRVIILQ